MIKAINLEKSFNDEVVFKGLEFYAKEGKFTLIQGKSGSGKSTLLNLLSTIDNVNKEAKLIINGEHIEKLNEYKRAKFRAKNIGFIFQSYALIPEFNIVQNCIIPLTMAGVKEKEAIKEAKKMIKNLIDDANEEFFYKNPTQLSGGQQQRISIARALIHKPNIIIADEPTANLDSQSATYIKKYLKKLSTQHNKTVIVVSHEQDYESYADCVYRFEPAQEKNVKSVLKEIK